MTASICRWTATFLSILAGLVAATPAGSADPPTPLRYRRVLVPQADLDQQIRGLLPLKRTEFERRIEQAALRGQALAAIAEARLDQSVYRARLDNDALVAGTSELTIASRSEQPAILALGPCNLALGAANWRAGSPRPAQLGNWPDGKLVCVVPRSGQLEFDWSLAGHRDETGALIFELDLPPAPVARLELELPVDAQLIADGGLATRAGSATAGKSQGRWLVEFGGSSRLALRVVTGGGPQRPEPLVLVREANDYQVTVATVDVESSLDLDILHRPIRQLVLALDESLVLTQVRVGAQSLAWAPLSTPANERRVIVHFPEPLIGEGIAVQVSGVANWNLAAKLRLPRLRVEGGVWQSGEASVSAPPGLPLDASPQDGCWQTAFSEAVPARQLVQWRFQYYQADAAIDVTALRTTPLLIQRSGLSLDVQPTQVQATLLAELSADSQSLFEVEGRIPRAWIVDSIDVQPADWLEDRTLQTQGTGPQILRMRLRQPLVPGRPMLLTVRAHRRRPADDQPLSGDAWTLLRLADVNHEHRLVELRVTDPALQVSLAGDESLRRVDPQSLSVADRKLFDAPPSGLMWKDEQEADGVRVRLLATIPRFHAQIAVRAEFQQPTVRQICRLIVQPDDSLLAALSVRFSPPPPDAVEWTIIGEDSRELVAERVVSPGANPEQAIYDLRLQRPRRTPVEIQARFARPATSSFAVPLVSLPGAATQAGVVEVHSLDRWPLAMEPGELRSVPPLDRRATELATLRGTFQYQPDKASELRVRVLPPGRMLPLAWVDTLRAHSRVSTDGSGEHEVELLLHNFGQHELVVRLDPTAANLRVDVQGRRLVGSLARRRTNEYVVPLPPAQRELTLRLSYTSPPVDSNWLPLADFQIPWPQPDVPVLNSEWQVHLASGLALRGDWPEPTPSPAVPVQSRVSTNNEPAWHVHFVAAPAGPTAWLAVYRPGVVAAWSWGVALIVSAVVLRIASPGVAWLAGLAGLFVALAVLLPGEFSILASGALVGVALGGALGLIRPRINRSTETVLVTGPRSTVNLGPALMLLAVMIGAAVVARAAPPHDTAEPVWRRVVVAVDENQQPVGDYVFLEPEFYDALLRLSERDTAGKPAWLLQSATYRPVMVSAGAAGPAVEKIQVALELESLLPDASVELPFDRREVHLVEGRAQLDGKPAATEWSPVGRLLVTLPMPGKHRLELSLSPTAVAVPDGLLCDIAIPPACASRVILPSGRDAPLVADPRGVAEAPAGAAERTWQVGPLRRLQLHRPIMTNPEAEAVSVEAEQFVLWSVRPGSIVAEASFRLRPVGGQVGEVAIEYDSRLRVLPLAAKEPVARQWTTEFGGTSVLHLVLREPAAAQTEVQVSFSWTGASGIGDLLPPPIQVRCDRLLRHWAAVALAGGLVWKTPPATLPSDPPAAELAVAAGHPMPEETVGFDLAKRPWPPLAIAPDQGRLSAIQQLACSFSLQSASVRYSAQLSHLPPHGFQHRLSVTGGLRIVRLSARDGDRPVHLRWIQSAGGNVIVQLAESPPPTLQLTAEGELPLPRVGGGHAVPLVQYVGATDDELTVSIFRLPAVQLAPRAVSPAWIALSPPDLGHYLADQGRLSGVFRRSDSVPPVPLQVVLSRNVPDVTGLALTRIVPGPGAWELDLRCSLEVAAGQLDGLRWELPFAVTGPFDINPAAEHEYSTGVGQAAGRLFVRPQVAIADALQVQVRAAIGDAAQAATAVPLAGLLDTPKVRRLVALPSRDGQRRFDWVTSGLQAVDPAHLSLPPQWLPPGYDLFEAVAPRPSAAVQVRTPFAPSAQLLLADHRVRLHSAGLLTGTSAFDLLPGGSRQVTLSVPPGMRLMHVSVEGATAQLAEQKGGQWSLLTAGSRTPQRIEVAYAGAVNPSGPSGEVMHMAPRLVGVEAAHTLWTIAGRASPGRGQPTETSNNSHALVRLEAIAATAESLAQPPGREMPAAALREAFEASEDRFLAAQAQLPLQTAPAVVQRAAAAEQRLLAARRRLMGAGFALAATSPTPIPRGKGANEQVWQSVETGDSPSIRVRYSPPGDEPADRRLAVAAAALAAGLLGWWLLASSIGQSWIARHAPFVAAAIGLAWLAVGPAPWIGGLLLALALWCAVRSPWPREGSHSQSSSVRLSRA